jgi:hypothetical protein
MSGAWVDKADNPGMTNWELHSADVYGAVVLVNFAAMAYRAAFTSDFQHLQPVQDIAQLANLAWLAPSGPEQNDGHCCIEPKCAGEAQQSGGSPSWQGAKKGPNHSTVPMICRL